MKLEDILVEEVLEEISLRRGLAAAGLAAGLAAGSPAAKADTELTVHSPKDNTTSTRTIQAQNSPEYNAKMYPAYQKMMQDFLDSHPNIDISFARDIVRSRWIAKYHTQPPSKPQ